VQADHDPLDTQEPQVTVSATAAAPQPIPQPGFAASLAPGEEELLWERDRSHFPGQLTTLEGELIGHMLAHGLTHGLRHYAVAVEEARVRVVHGHLYQAMVPTVGSPEDMAALADLAEHEMSLATGRLRARWEQQWLPEIVEHLVAMESADLRAVPTPALMDVLDGHRERMLRLWELHFEIVFPAYVAVSEFDDLHRDLFGGEGLDAYRLLHGFQSRTLEVGRDLWRLSRVVLGSADVAEVFAREAAADIPARLEQSPAGRVFLAELTRHLARYGHRTTNWGLSTPSFVEDPSPVLKVIKDYVTQPDSADPGRELERLAREREAAVAEARERLQGYPAPVVDQFEAMLEAAQVGLVLTEDHGFYIDAYAVSLARDVIAAIGRRLADAGVLDDREDVLMLTYEELRDATRGARRIDARALVGARRAALAPHAAVAPPPVLGTMPAGPPPDGPLMRLRAKSAGEPQPSSDPDVIRGRSGSAGTATGVARVVGSLADAEALQPGEVLVAETTAPPWTPLFALAAAVVTDTGGILSHSAVVAREYGIPAVVGAGTATSVVADGDVVEVDGDAGTVRILR
jgi:pyruvate,water dikinase